jgi:hypothetical protein
VDNPYLIWFGRKVSGKIQPPYLIDMKTAGSNEANAAPPPFRVLRYSSGMLCPDPLSRCSLRWALMRVLKLWPALIVLVLGFTTGRSGLAQSAGLDGAHSSFANPPDDSRIMMRWRWFGPTESASIAVGHARPSASGGVKIRAIGMGAAGKRWSRRPELNR